jgi:hypothetical protein
MAHTRVSGSSKVGAAYTAFIASHENKWRSQGLDTFHLIHRARNKAFALKMGTMVGLDTFHLIHRRVTKLFLYHGILWCGRWAQWLRNVVEKSPVNKRMRDLPTIS